MAAAWRNLTPLTIDARGRLYFRLFSVANRVVVIGSGQSRMVGAVFDPIANTWLGEATSRESWRDGYGSALMLQGVFIWGGANYSGDLNDGGIFDGITLQWRSVPRSPLSGRSWPTLAWTDSEVIVVNGGTDEPRFPTDGAAFNPLAGVWRTVRPFPGSGRFAALAVWTGEEMLVWGGVGPSGFLTDGFSYEPLSDSWRPMAPAPITGRLDLPAIWTGQEMIVWGGTQRSEEHGPLDDGAAYDPVADSWRLMGPSPLSGRFAHSGVWTGTQAIFWGGSSSSASEGQPHVVSDGAMYEPAEDTWLLLPGGPLAGRYRHGAAWNGSEMIVWGGCCTGPQRAGNFIDGAAYSPA
jgi:hypothetical protein